MSLVLVARYNLIIGGTAASPACGWACGRCLSHKQKFDEGRGGGDSANVVEVVQPLIGAPRDVPCSRRPRRPAAGPDLSD